MNFSILWLLAIMMLPLFIPMIFIPFWTRKTDSFGVSIPEEVYHHSEIKKMRQKYAWINAAFALVTSIIFLNTASGHDEKYISHLFLIFIFVFLFVNFTVYLFFHSQMKFLKKNHQDWIQKPQQIIVDIGFRNQKLAYSNYWFIIPYAISIFTVIFTLTNYPNIPGRFPMQYSMSGEVTQWGTKSYRSVLLMPIMQIYLTSLFLFINNVISKAKQQVASSDPEESIRQNVVFRRRWSLFMLIMGTGLILTLMLPQLSFIYPLNRQLLIITPIVFVIGVCAASLILSITTGQGGSHVPKKVSSDNMELIDRDDDRYWKLGMFYFNRNDPAIFLEKRFGIGWTNNWAHPLSWIILVIIILIAAGLPKLFR